MDAWINSTTIAPNAVQERLSQAQVALVAEANLMANWQVTKHFSLRGGVQGLLLEGVALASENFNTADPYAARTPVMNTNGNAFYVGLTAGGEFVW